MEKLVKPNKLSELLEANKTRVKKGENYIMPKNGTDFDKQQADRFAASATNFNEWNMEFRRELHELSLEIFDKWKESYGEQLLVDWKKGTAPKEAAAIIFDMFRTDTGEIKKKKRVTV